MELYRLYDRDKSIDDRGIIFDEYDLNRIFNVTAEELKKIDDMPYQSLQIDDRFYIRKAGAYNDEL